MLGVAGVDDGDRGTQAIPWGTSALAAGEQLVLAGDGC